MGFLSAVPSSTFDLLHTDLGAASHWSYMLNSFSFLPFSLSSFKWFCLETNRWAAKCDTLCPNNVLLYGNVILLICPQQEPCHSVETTFVGFCLKKSQQPKNFYGHTVCYDVSWCDKWPSHLLRDSWWHAVKQTAIFLWLFTPRIQRTKSPVFKYWSDIRYEICCFP